MKRVGDIMKEMGFKEDASAETKKAFIRHLIQVATKNEIPRIPQKPAPQAPKAEPEREEEKQLAFEFDEPFLKCERKSAG